MTSGGTAEERTATEIAAAAIDNQEEAQWSVTFDNGIRLRLRPVNRLLISQAASTIRDPEPPMADIGKGREEPFPDDPAYQEELARIALLRMEVGGHAAIAMGSTLEFVPEGMQRPEDEGWVADTLALNELTTAAGGKASDLRLGTPTERYLSWLNCYAVGSENDQMRLTEALLRCMGVTLDEVAAAMATFPGKTQRGAAEPVPAAPAGADGNNRRARRAGARPAAG